MYYLSGLTCTDENCVQKGGVAAAVSKHGVIVVLPDTSPRGAGAPGEDETYSFGTGAGFYVDATAPGYEAYQMASFIEKELPTAVSEALGTQVDVSKAGIFGHSMGGSGALTIGLRNPEKYASVSAFAPICNPVNSEWGKVAFGKYLGCDNADGTWNKWDAVELIKSGKQLPAGTLIDQGSDDEFLEKKQLQPEKLKEAEGVVYNLREGYGHGYWFVATFMDDHIAHHAKALLQ